MPKASNTPFAARATRPDTGTANQESTDRRAGSLTRGVLCVYRSSRPDSVRRVRDLIDKLGPDWGVALWALDAVDPLLAQWTEGAGPGGKFDNCNRLLATLPEPWDYTVVLDDDVICDELSQACDYMSRTGLDLAQPAHSRRSHSTYQFCRRRPHLAGRLTNFVEIGPIFIVGPGLREQVLPFPSGLGMGWGLEFEWYDTAQRVGRRLGIIDSVQMRHLGTLGEDYDMAEAGVALRAALDAHGVPDCESFQATESRHFAWQRTPQWQRG